MLIEHSPTPKSERNSTYASPSIVARRNRILDETCQMIGDVGIAELSMDEVAKRSDVAKRTLYNAFQSREHLIACAIRRYYANYAVEEEIASELATVQWMVDRLHSVVRHTIKMRNYLRAIMIVYFSTDVDPEIRQAIHDRALQSHDSWVRAIERKGGLQPWISSSALADLLVRFRYATALDWTERRITDEEFVHALVQGFLITVAGATQGAIHTEVIAALSRLDAAAMSAETMEYFA